VDANDITILKEIGRGSFGIVYKAEWRKVSVAVKRLMDVSEDSALNIEFINEIKLMMSIRIHPNVVSILGVSSNPISVLLVFMEGGSLEKYLKSAEIIPTWRINSIIMGITKGIFHLHKENIIHRDIAARNILLTSLYEPKVSDFGLARTNKKEENVTVSEVGPLKWMAPECIESKKYSTKSDVWAFGITIIEILTKELPYPTLSNIITASKIVNREISPVSMIPKYTSVGLTDLLKKCFQFNEESRPEFDVILSSLESIFKIESMESIKEMIDLPQNNDLVYITESVYTPKYNRV